MLATIIIAVVLMSLFELILPGGNTKKVALSVMSIIVIGIIISPVVAYLQNPKSFPLENFKTEVTNEKKSGN